MNHNPALEAQHVLRRKDLRLLPGRPSDGGHDVQGASGSSHLVTVGASILPRTE